MPRKDDVPVLAIFASILPKIKVVKDMYMQNNDVLSDKEGIELPPVHAIAIWMGMEYIRLSIAPKDFIHEQQGFV